MLGLGVYFDILELMLHSEKETKPSAVPATQNCKTSSNNILVNLFTNMYTRRVLLSFMSMLGYESDQTGCLLSQNIL